MPPTPVNSRRRRGTSQRERDHDGLPVFSTPVSHADPDILERGRNDGGRERDRDGLPVLSEQPRFTQPPNFAANPDAVAAVS